MVGQSGSRGCCRRVIAKEAWILTLGNLSVTRTSMAWWMRSKRSSSIWAFSAILPSNLLISWHTRKRTAWLLALWDYKKSQTCELWFRKRGENIYMWGKSWQDSRNWVKKICLPLIGSWRWNSGMDDRPLVPPLPPHCSPADPLLLLEETGNWWKTLQQTRWHFQLLAHVCKQSWRASGNGQTLHGTRSCPQAKKENTQRM